MFFFFLITPYMYNICFRYFNQCGCQLRLKSQQPSTNESRNICPIYDCNCWSLILFYYHSLLKSSTLQLIHIGMYTTNTRSTLVKKSTKFLGCTLENVMHEAEMSLIMLSRAFSKIIITMFMIK
jgi:hypothetical protein